MKFATALVLFCAAVCAVSPSFAQAPAAGATPSPQAPAFEAEILRKTTARQIDASGMGGKPYPVNKGAKYDVISQTMSDVVLGSQGLMLRLPKADVRISAKSPSPSADPNAPAPARGPSPFPMSPQDPRAIEAARVAAAQAAEAAAIAAFKPGGELTIISARYSLTGNSPRNVKNKVEKMVPLGPLTAPVRILVTDQLHRSAANEPEALVYQDRNNTQVVHLRKNVLTVVYEYQGQKLTKDAEEGTAMILP